MFKIPKKTTDRINESLKTYQSVIQSAVSRDVNETDTVTIIKDFFSDCFGYDKYNDLTSEYSIRGTYCDLAVKIDNKIKLLIEVKAPGISLKEQQIKQAVDYASNSGVEWVVLTNALHWKLYKVEFRKPIATNLVAEFNILELLPKKSETEQCLYLFSKEGMTKSVLDDFYDHHVATSRYVLGALVLSEPVLNSIKKEFRRINKDVKIDNEQLLDLLKTEVLKREIVDSEEIKDASKVVKKRVSRARNKSSCKKPEISAEPKTHDSQSNSSEPAA